MLSSADAYDESWSVSVAALRDAGVELVEVDLSGFIEAGGLLYEGPWLAERLAGTADFLDEHPDEVHPVVRSLLERGRAVPGLDVFRGIHRLRRLRRDAYDLLASVDALLTPTVSTTFTVDEMLDRPIERNTELGRFTTFGNLLDLSIVAIPAKAGRPDRPFGVSIVAGVGQDARVAGIAEALERVFAGEPEVQEPEAQEPAAQEPAVQNTRSDSGGETLAIAVVGAHLSGMPLHGELVMLAARLRVTTVTAPEYRLYALETTPAKPGLVRVGDGGERIAVEVYDLPIENVGPFLAGIASPLGLGTILLEDGQKVHGFLCEQIAVAGAPDVTRHGGWRAYMASR
jgi:allophanate hydrolase